MAITVFLSRSPGLLNWGPRGPTSLGHVPLSSIFSPTDLNSNCSIRGLGAQPLWDMFLFPASSLQLIWTPTVQSGARGPSLSGCWFSLQRLISNWLNYLCTELYNYYAHSSSCERHNFALNSTHPQSRLYPDIPRLDVPVIYTGAFPILTAWPGRRSIGNKYSF